MNLFSSQWLADSLKTHWYDSKKKPYQPIDLSLVVRRACLPCALAYFTQLRYIFALASHMQMMSASSFRQTNPGLNPAVALRFGLGAACGHRALVVASAHVNFKWSKALEEEEKSVLQEEKEEDRLSKLLSCYLHTFLSLFLLQLQTAS